MSDKTTLEGYLYIINDYEFYDYIVLENPLDPYNLSDRAREELIEGQCIIHEDGISCTSVPLGTYTEILGATSLYDILDKYKGKRVRITIEVID